MSSVVWFRTKRLIAHKGYYSDDCVTRAANINRHGVASAFDQDLLTHFMCALWELDNPAPSQVLLQKMDDRLCALLADGTIIFKKYDGYRLSINAPYGLLAGRDVCLLPESKYRYVLGLTGGEVRAMNHTTVTADEPAISGGLTCFRCNFHNEYAGREHLKDGKYICFNCK